MVWVRDSTQLIITLDHVWAWDNRSHPLKDPDRFNYQSFRAAIEAHDKSFLDIIPFHHHWHLPAKTHVGRVVIDFGRADIRHGKTRFDERRDQHKPTDGVRRYFFDERARPC